MTKEFYLAALENRVELVAKLLRDHPNLNVNYKPEGSKVTALHAASEEGHVEIVKLLLAHPDIDVNKLGFNRYTALSLAVQSGHENVVRALLKDPRVQTFLPDDDGHTPLWWASLLGYFEVVKWMIVSGRELCQELNGIFNGREYTAMNIAIRFQGAEIASLLERFMANPEQTRYELSVELGVQDEHAAKRFALTAFLHDGLLQIINGERNKPAARFFAIAQRMPMELQMILARRVVGSMKDNVLSKDSEPAFRELARVLLLE